MVLAVALVGCRGTTDATGVTATDTQPADDTANEAAGSTAETNGGGPCGAGICAQLPPEGWFGPVVRFDNDGSLTAPACGGGWPDAAFTLLGGYVDPGPAVCSECTCSVDIERLCTLSGYRTEGSDVCGFRDAFELASADACEPIAVDDGSLWLHAFTDAMPACMPA